MYRDCGMWTWKGASPAESVESKGPVADQNAGRQVRAGPGSSNASNSNSITTEYLLATTLSYIGIGTLS